MVEIRLFVSDINIGLMARLYIITYHSIGYIYRIENIVCLTITLLRDIIPKKATSRELNIVYASGFTQQKIVLAVALETPE